MFANTSNLSTFTKAEKIFELSYHLGNVLVTISDKKIGHDGGNRTIDFYNADIISAQDYYPFGMQMPGRKYSVANSAYRYGFNGKENDNEVKGEGNQQDYGMRIYDPRLGKFLSVDPLTEDYPELTPYQFASNRPIDGVDLDGLEWRPSFFFRSSLPIILLPTAKDVKLMSDVAKNNPNSGKFSLALKYGWQASKGKIHTGLDVAGLIPIVGEVPDAVNGGLYLLEKDYENAAFSFAATVPFVGWAATGGKWAKNALKFSDNAFHSVSGLVFKQIGKENRLGHVLKHTVNDLKKSYHGVFDATQNGVVELLDDAYSKIKSMKWNTKLGVGESETIGGISRSIRKEESGRISENFVVDAGKRIGTEGGKKGSGQALNRVQISVEKGTDNVITAFPTK